MNDLELLSFDLNTGYLGESNGYNSSVEITLKFKKKNLPHLLSTGLLFSFSLSMQFIGAFRLSVKCGRCQLTNDTSSKSSQAVCTTESTGCTRSRRNVCRTGQKQTSGSTHCDHVLDFT